MRGCHMDFSRPVFREDLSGSTDRTRGANDIVKHQDGLSLHRATDDVLLFRFLGTAAAFVDDCQAASESFDVSQGPLDAAFIGTDDDNFVNPKQLWATLEHSLLHSATTKSLLPFFKRTMMKNENPELQNSSALSESIDYLVSIESFPVEQYSFSML